MVGFLDSFLAPILNLSVTGDKLGRHYKIKVTILLQNIMKVISVF